MSQHRMHGLSTHIYRQEWHFLHLLKHPKKISSRLRRKNWNWAVMENYGGYSGKVLASGFTWTRWEAGERAASEYVKIVNVRKLKD